MSVANTVIAFELFRPSPFLLLAMTLLLENIIVQLNRHAGRIIHIQLLLTLWSKSVEAVSLLNCIPSSEPDRADLDGRFRFSIISSFRSSFLCLLLVIQPPLSVVELSHYWPGFRASSRFSKQVKACHSYKPRHTSVTNALPVRLCLPRCVRVN